MIVILVIGVSDCLIFCMQVSSSTSLSCQQRSGSEDQVVSLARGNQECIVNHHIYPVKCFFIYCWPATQAFIIQQGKYLFSLRTLSASVSQILCNAFKMILQPILNIWVILKCFMENNPQGKLYRPAQHKTTFLSVKILNHQHLD